MSTNDQIRLRLTNLRLALKLRPDQAAAWQAYENKVLEFISEAGDRPGIAANVNMPTQLDGLVAAERKRAATVEQIGGAARNLYADLSTEQRRVADDALVATIPTQSLSLPAPGRQGWQ